MENIGGGNIRFESKNITVKINTNGHVTAYFTGFKIPDGYRILACDTKVSNANVIAGMPFNDITTSYVPLYYYVGNIDVDVELTRYYIKINNGYLIPQKWT